MSHPVPTLENTPEPALNRLRRIVHILRAPGGCPWDIEQTHSSLVPNLIEEAYECVEALQSVDKEHQSEELGDLLLQVIMHAEIANETGAYDLDKVAEGISEKLIRRHPHVFGESDADDPDTVLKQWDEIKRQEKTKDGVRPRLLDNISHGLPSLIRAAKIQKKVAKVGFDWASVDDVFPKVSEELGEVKEALGDEEKVQEELGDLLFSVVNLSRKLGYDAEAMLARANAKFIGRFEKVEDSIPKLEDATLEEMDAAWENAKL